MGGKRTLDRGAPLSGFTAWHGLLFEPQRQAMNEQQTTVAAEARLYALETAVRMLVTIVMRDQPGALASIVASVRENASSRIDKEFADEDHAVKEQMRKAKLAAAYGFDAAH
jgi:hypothetical protein